MPEACESKLRAQRLPHSLQLINDAIRCTATTDCKPGGNGGRNQPDGAPTARLAKHQVPGNRHAECSSYAAGVIACKANAASAIGAPDLERDHPRALPPHCVPHRCAVPKPPATFPDPLAQTASSLQLGNTHFLPALTHILVYIPSLPRFVQYKPGIRRPSSPFLPLP